MNPERHNEPGHVNVYVRDQDSDVTGRGKHNRLLVGKPVEWPGIIVIREDIKHGLQMSTEADRQVVAKSWQRLHPKGTLLVPVTSTEPYLCGSASWKAIDHVYVITRNGKPVHPDVLQLQNQRLSKYWWSKPMSRMPSQSPGDWLKFQGPHVVGTELSEQDQHALQEFMRRLGSEALTNGDGYFTLAGDRLAICYPHAFAN